MDDVLTDSEPGQEKYPPLRAASALRQSPPWYAQNWSSGACSLGPTR
jgi:hypothetical protein